MLLNCPEVAYLDRLKQLCTGDRADGLLQILVVTTKSLHRALSSIGYATESDVFKDEPLRRRSGQASVTHDGHPSRWADREREAGYQEGSRTSHSKSKTGKSQFWKYHSYQS